MISFDFEYVKPTSADEAVSLFEQFTLKGKKVMYYAGGTEFISRARMNEIHADVVIDVKAIPECTKLRSKENELVIGAAKTLTEIAEENDFPLLSNIVREIATRTVRNKITIGGNITSNLPYKEGILPFLLANSKLVIATKKGMKTVQIADIFDEKLRLKKEEFIVQILSETHILNTPFYHQKKTKHSRVNYPVLTIASVLVDDKVRVAFSGLCSFPFRMKEIDKALNDNSIPNAERIHHVIELLPAPIMEDMHATAKYREFVLERTLIRMLKEMEGRQSC